MQASILYKELQKLRDFSDKSTASNLNKETGFISWIAFLTWEVRHLAWKEFNEN